MADDFRINGVNDPWYQYRNIMGVPSRKRIICGIIWIFLILTLVVIAFTVMSKQCCAPKIEKLERYEAFKSFLNTSVDPCVNFYDFTCGLWSHNNFIPPDKPRVTSFSILQDAIDEKKKNIFVSSQVDQDLPNIVNNAIKFYDLCISEHRNDIDEYKTLVDFLNQFGGWPILDETKWDEDLFDWIQASIFISKNVNVNTIFKFFLLDKDRNDGLHTFIINNPNLFDDFGKQLRYNSNMLAAVLFILNSSYTQSDVDNLEEIESKWIQLFYDYPHKKSDPFIVSVGELLEQIPKINWLNYFQLMMNDTLFSENETVSLNDTVVIEDVEYLKKVERVLSSDTFSKLELANLFGWFVVRDIWEIIPGALQRYSLVFGYEPADTKVLAKEKCYELTEHLFSCSLEYLYIKNTTISGIQDSNILISYVESAFNDILHDSNWLDEVSKETMLYKLHTMKHIIGFQTYLNNKTEFDELNKDFPAASNNLLQYFLKIHPYNGKFKSWMLPRSVTDVSAYYMLNKNTFVFPISLHNPPFYYLNGPSYLNFGAIGSVIAHEMMHGFGTFDDDEKYFLSNLFSSKSSIDFKKRAECFKDQYEIYDSNEMHKNNGTITLRENIADSEGLHIAFEAYKKYEKDFGYKNQYQPESHYSPDQMLFISYGTYLCAKIRPEMLVMDTHSPPELRVNGAVSNSVSFALTFNCPKGSPMNPVKKCSIW